MRHKLLLFATTILLLSPGTGKALAGNSENDKGYSFMQQYKVSTPLSLNVSTTGGNISTAGYGGNTVEVSFIVSSRGKVLDISFDQLKKYAEVEINNEGAKLDILVNKIFEKNVSIGFSIKTPVNTSVNLNTSGGNLDVEGISGNQTLKTSGGNIDLDKLSGNIFARTSGGNISLSDSPADFDVSTSGGNISMDNISGKLDVSTSGGNIHAENITKGLLAKTSGGNINLTKVTGTTDVHTSGGGIRLEEMDGDVKATTSGGGIKADLAKLSGKLELRTSGSSIDVTLPRGLGLDLDLTADDINATLTNFNGVNKKERVKGQLNGGGIPVILSTSGGSIDLSFR
jgi:hypothetical protein